MKENLEKVRYTDGSEATTVELSMKPGGRLGVTPIVLQTIGLISCHCLSQCKKVDF